MYAYYHRPPPHSTSCSTEVEYVRQWVEGKRPPAQVATGVKTPPVQGVFAPMAEGITPPAQVAVSDHHQTY